MKTVCLLKTKGEDCKINDIVWIDNTYSNNRIAILQGPQTETNSIRKSNKWSQSPVKENWLYFNFSNVFNGWHRLDNKRN